MYNPCRGRYEGNADNCSSYLLMIACFPLLVG
jgi:hypothetical protein